MRKSKVIKWQDKEVTVKELTVAEMESVMDEYRPTPLDIILNRDAPAEAVTISTGVELDAMRECTPSALEPLFGAVEELNPSLVALMGQLKKTVMAKLGAVA